MSRRVQFFLMALMALSCTDKNLGEARPAAASLPGAEPFDAATVQSLNAALAQTPHAAPYATRNLGKDGEPLFTNRLILTTSPYLREHAHNPVNWYAYGPQAFAEARRLGRPVFLSIGYSTCHWCHVMADESFDDVETARILNENYVAIKVDREELPDIDATYMQAAQMMGVRGGWPLNVWLTPDGLPFFAGNYFGPNWPDSAAHGKGFVSILKDVRQSYAKAPDAAAARGQQWLTQMQQAWAPQTSTSVQSVKTTLIDAAMSGYRARFDGVSGGLHGAPKFPSSLPLRLLLQEYARGGDTKSLDMAVTTFEHLAAGGIHDQLGGGFHRYAVDSVWHTPHFEKMLYDNALLLTAYADAYQVTHRPQFAAMVHDITDFLRRDLAAPKGGYFSAIDADSLDPAGIRQEGWYYTWTESEISGACGAGTALARAYFGIEQKTVVSARQVLSAQAPLETVAHSLQIDSKAASNTLQKCRSALLALRARRTPPAKDTKINTAWNGLTLSALARAAWALNDSDLLTQATLLADFMLSTLLQDGVLVHTHVPGEVHLSTPTPGYLDDYAFTIAGLLRLYEVGGQLRYLKSAMELTAVVERDYAADAGPYYFTSRKGHKPLVDAQPITDSASPSGNSVHVLNLLRLEALTGDEAYAASAQRVLGSVLPALQRDPLDYSEMLLAVAFREANPKQIIIVAPSAQAAAPLQDALRSIFAPNSIMSLASSESDRADKALLIAAMRDRPMQKGETTAYVCQGKTCSLPTHDPNTLRGYVVAREAK